MGPFFTSSLLAIGAGVWVFTKLQNRTGYGNSRGAILGAVVTGLGIFLVVYLTLRLFWS
jgi:hypothetical protein